MKNWLKILFFSILLVSCRSNESALQPSVSPAEAVPSPGLIKTSVLETITPEVNETSQIRITGTGQPQATASIPVLSPDRTLTYTVTFSPANNLVLPTDKIYGWTTGGHVGYFDLAEDRSSLWNEFYAGEYRPSGPNLWSSLNFSPYTDNIAYLTGTDTSELWISDLDLKHPERVWIDNGEWLGYVGGIASTRIVWGIDDRYVILIPLSPENHVVVYDVKDKSTVEWTGACDLIADSPSSEGLVIWCEHSEDDPEKGYLVLGKDGIIRTKEQPEILSRVIDWAYSPNGERLLFADEDLNIYTTLPGVGLLKLPVSYESSEFFDVSTRQNLQWSQDGRNVLVYGYGNPKSLCPQWMREKLEDRPCWLVLDANTGKDVWNPAGEITGLGIPWEYLEMVHGAALSEDGKWLATISFDMTKPGRNIFLLIASLKENKTIAMEGEETFHLHWAH